MIQKTTFRNQIREYLFTQMLKGKIKGGDQLSLAELSRELDVSVTPIREALSQLENSQVIVSIPNRGFYIKKMNVIEAKGAYELIGALESLALSYSTFSQSEIELLFEVQEKFNQTDDYGKKLKLDNRFHELLTANYDNPFWNETIRNLKICIFMFEQEYMEQPSFTEQSVKSHKEILQKISSGEIKKAADLLKTHWSLTLKLISELKKVNK